VNAARGHGGGRAAAQPPLKLSRRASPAHAGKTAIDQERRDGRCSRRVSIPVGRVPRRLSARSVDHLQDITERRFDPDLPTPCGHGRFGGHCLCGVSLPCDLRATLGRVEEKRRLLVFVFLPVVVVLGVCAGFSLAGYTAQVVPSFAGFLIPFAVASLLGGLAGSRA
jgi:hypothetical protein